ncbi:hypothetical protein [Arthrobacter sp. ZGTC412]|uniref:hypothetical protein n=1 Tax=Arthrobacter sp. ZGTC412 TaxID=2058900 RepID=UPI000CE399F7|nr:hypothetical protein [Arthrobacter sp. ZGTC412]
MDDAKPSARAGSLAWVAGPLSTGLGLVAHLAAGGTAPSLMIIEALAALLGMAAAILGRFPVPGWALLLLCGVAQQLLHLGFAVFSGGSGSGLSEHGHGGITQEPSPAGEVAAPAGYSLHLMLHLHMAAALAAYAAINYWPRLARWSGRIWSGRREIATR